MNAQEILELLNLHPFRHSKYLFPSGEWQKYFFEFEIKIEWLWLDELIISEYNQETSDKFLHSQDFSKFIQHKINQEIIILRSLTNRSISSRPFDLIYTGWFSPNIGGGGIDSPWNNPKETAQLSSENMSDYQKYRQIFQNIDDNKTKQQIFVAMRKLAFGMDKIYSGDEVLDTISGLEGLLVSEKNEVTHKCAERTAILLEQEIEKRIQLQIDIREAYRLRSNVAHGSAIIDDEDSIISKRYLRGKEAASKDYRELNKNRKLRQISRDSLYRAIIICIQQNTTNFDWDSALMGKNIF